MTTTKTETDVAVGSHWRKEKHGVRQDVVVLAVRRRKVKLGHPDREDAFTIDINALINQYRPL